MTVPLPVLLALAYVLSPAGNLAAQRRATPAFALVSDNLLIDMADPPPKERPALFIPPRPQSAPTGSQFLRETEHLSLADRENRVEAELASGNIPSFLRHFVPVRLEGRSENRLAFHGWAFVMPDYLAIGNDKDYVRVPMNPLTAQRLVDAFGCVLPTSKIVDATYAAARVKVPPHPLPAHPRMRSNAWLREHEDFVQGQLLFHRQGHDLVAGQKKDVVLSNRLVTRPLRVAIYGWHMPGGEPIQTLSTVHKKSYSDYSHGVRPVFGTILVGHQEWPLADVLRHPSLWILVSEEGPIEDTAYDRAEPIWTNEELHPL